MDANEKPNADLCCPQYILKGAVLQLLAFCFRDCSVVLSDDLVGLQHSFSMVDQPAQSIITSHKIYPCIHTRLLRNCLARHHVSFRSN